MVTGSLMYAGSGMPLNSIPDDLRSKRPLFMDHSKSPVIQIWPRIQHSQLS